jgi:AcrR family transcriptional regulator
MKTERRPYRQTARAEAQAATRERIMEAAVPQFLERWYDEVTLAGVARDAGVSQQTLINHFGSKEGLLEAAVEHLGPERRRRAADDPVAGVVDDYEIGGDAMIRFLALEPRLPAVSPFLDLGRANHRAWVEEAFAERLPARGPERERLVHALLVATDVYTWKRLRRDASLTREETIEAMRALLP